MKINSYRRSKENAIFRVSYNTLSDSIYLYIAFSDKFLHPSESIDLEVDEGRELYKALGSALKIAGRFKRKIRKKGDKI